ncbi:MAG: hypothetical protein U0704_16410 [Candidatus Eisenbacteria bacterium]
MSRLGSFPLALCVAAVLAAPAFAQEETPVAVPDTTAAPAAVDSSAALPATPPPAAAPAAASALAANSPRPTRPHQMTPRPESVIRGELDQFAMLASAAEGDLAAAKKRRADAKATVEIKKKEIDVLEARIKAAKQAQDDAGRASFEAEKKRQEAMREYFQKTEDVEEAAMDEAKARADWARLSTRALQLEMQLIGRAGLATYDSDGGLFKQEQQFFEARKQAGAGQERVANRVQSYMERKQKLYRAWADYLAGK